MSPTNYRHFYLMVICLLVLTLGAGPAAAGDPKPGPWTVDDLLLAERATNWSLSRDGRLAAWVRAGIKTVDGEEQRVANVWLTTLADGKSQQLTRGTDWVSGIALAPDARHLAFLSTRDLPDDGAEKKGDDQDARPQIPLIPPRSLLMTRGDAPAHPQLWAIPLRGGEAFPLTRFERPVRDFAWIDSETLVVLAQESPAALEKERKKQKDTTVVVDDAEHEPPVRLFRVPLDGKTERLRSDREWIDSLAVSSDGTRAVVTVQQSLHYEFDQQNPPHTYLVDLTTGTRTRILTGGDLLPFAIRWSPDGSGFYFINQHTRHPTYRMATIWELYFYDLGDGAATRVDLDWDRGLGGGYAPAADGVVVLLAHGVRYRAARCVRTGRGWKRQDLEGTHVRNLDVLGVAHDGRTVLYRTSSVTEPPQWYGAVLDGPRLVDERRLTDLNSGWEGKPTGRAEAVQWTGARGETVEGLLHYPLDWREGERRPLVLDVHGGPAGTDLDSWSQSWASPNLLWRQRGAFVFQVNYHGSAGYGLDWVESIRDHYYELEIPDIESGVDSLVERGLVDPERLACSGWSNGGILCAELITRTRRYRAASVGAADVEWISDWANVDFGAAFDNYYFGAPPWEDPQGYVDKSPFFRLTEVDTPTIIHTGTEDRNVPPHQSWSLFRALQYIKKAEVRLLLYPGEPHGLRKVAHQRRKTEEDLAWFDRYLFATHEAENEAIREGSLIDALLKRSAVARRGRSLGADRDGVLVPETVVYEGLRVGRFELTRAQFAAFDPAFDLVPGEENLPLIGVAFERARAYVEWLAATTGAGYRLPTVAEAERLARAAGSGGNTLDRWAGYTPNPDDAERIAGALAAGNLASEAPLILPVGQLPGRGSDLVYDLDGNAAEWAVGEDGRGVAVGPSAERSTDPRSRAPAAAAYTGLRVVLDDGAGGP